MNNLPFQSATNLAQQIRAGELSSVEALETYIEQAQQYNHSVNAVVTWDCDRARQRAHELDLLAKQNQFVGPLHGLPITVKDTFETAGLLTTAGSPKLINHIPTDNAVAVQRLLDAGAIIFGKTNTPTFAADIQTNNEVFGCTNNPWDVSRTCGGSSGGSAVATAMGFGAFEMGSDIGGSLRIPASFCGVYTIKPSYGIIPTAGMLSTNQRKYNPRDISCVGPFARDAEDLSLLLDVLAGPDSLEAAGWQLHLPTQFKPLKKLKIAAWLDDEFCPVDQHVLAQLQLAVEKIQQQGIEIDFNVRPDFSLAEATDIYIRCLAATSVADMPREAIDKRRATINDYSQQQRQGLAFRAVEYSLMDAHQVAQAKEAQARLRHKWHRFFSEYDVLLCPTSPTAAFPHIHSEANFFESININGQTRDYAEMWVWIGALAGVAYLPAVSAPIGLTADGLPTSVQIIAPYLHDHVAIDVAKQLAEITGGFQIPPLATT